MVFGEKQSVLLDKKLVLNVNYNHEFMRETHQGRIKKDLS